MSAKGKGKGKRTQRSDDEGKDEAPPTKAPRTDEATTASGMHHHHHHQHQQEDDDMVTDVAAPPATSAPTDPSKGAGKYVPLRKEIVHPKWSDVTEILMFYGSCMKDVTGLDFSNEVIVKHAWDMIMDAAIPFDGRRQRVVEDEATGAYWLLRNQLASMPYYDPDKVKKPMPEFGQFTDAELRTLNNWGECEGLTSFRDAIETCGPVGLSTEALKLTRYDVDTIWRTPLFTSQILDGFRMLKNTEEFPRVNPKSATANLGEWGDIAAIHGGPWQVYSSGKNGLAMWCWHHVFQFLPWHRPWLAAMEAALADAQSKAGYANPIGLPYWDQTKPYIDAEGNESYRNGHPLFFTKTYKSLADNKEYPNPLCPVNAESLFDLEGHPLLNNTTRRIIRGWPEQAINESDNSLKRVKELMKVKTAKEVVDKWNDKDFYFDFSKVKYPDANSPDTLVDWMKKHLAMATQQPNFYTPKPLTVSDKDPRTDMIRLGQAQWIETVHNQIHNWIGLDCQDASIAGYDPILYFFHANIDRQFQTVIDRQGENIFRWLAQTPEGTAHVKDLTLLHMPVPYPPELHHLLRHRLGTSQLPKYKNCFQLDWFHYVYEEPYVFPTMKEAFPDPHRKSSWVVVADMPPMGSNSLVVKDEKGVVLGKTQTLRMSMYAGRMRMIVSPVLLDPILVEHYKEPSPAAPERALARPSAAPPHFASRSLLVRTEEVHEGKTHANEYQGASLIWLPTI